MKHHWRAAAALLAFVAAGGPALAQDNPGAPGPTIPNAAPNTPDAPAPARSRPGPALTVEEVIALQTLLAQLGFDPRGIDGVVGPETRAAIAAAQQTFGLAVDGEPSLALLERLQQELPGGGAPSVLPPR